MKNTSLLPEFEIELYDERMQNLYASCASVNARLSAYWKRDLRHRMAKQNVPDDWYLKRLHILPDDIDKVAARRLNRNG
jgi:hypothetical protein